MTQLGESPQERVFGRSRLRFETMLAFLEGDEATGLSHGQLEDHLQVAGRELGRELCSDHLDLRAPNEARLETVADSDGVPRRAVEAGHERALTTVFGQVEVRRLAYRRKGRPNLHPADAALDLPAEKHSHGLRRLAALEASRGSFDGAAAAVERATGQALGKRQAEALAARSAVDFDGFYAGRAPPQAHPCDVVVLSG